jgi:hypothetical protein
MSDIEYILPKTYNGKTVTELFPEFKFNSVRKYFFKLTKIIIKSKNLIR